jgi:eukaryotic-like serine/threonine-protein kinase
LLERMTFGPASEMFPLWTPDGKWLFFLSSRTGGGIYRQRADMPGDLEQLTTSPSVRGLWTLDSLSPDGKQLVVTQVSSRRRALFLLTVDGFTAHVAAAGQAQPLIQLPSASVMNGEVSPNGRWLAYQSNESNQDEIHVRPFPSGDGRWPISNGGGTQPLWARNGRELFYRHGNTLLSVPVETTATFSAGTPTTVFEGSYFSPPVGLAGRTYDVSPDGQRFLMIKDAPAGDPNVAPASIDVVLNWFEELKRLLPTK